MRIAHISDVHISAPPESRGQAIEHDIFNRRIVSRIITKLIGGSELFSNRLFTAALQDMQGHAVDHLIISGDLTDYSYDAEFEEALRLLAAYFPPERCSVVPGNHDSFLRTTVQARSFTKYFGPYATSNVPWTPDIISSSVRHEPGFPFIRVLGQSIAVIGLNSAAAHRLPFHSSGEIDEDQFVAAKKQISSLRSTNPSLLKLFVVHHPPRYGDGGLISEVRHDMLPSSVERCWELFDLAGPNTMVLHGHNHIPYQGRLGNKEKAMVFDAGAGTFVQGDEETIARYNLYDFDERLNSLQTVTARVWNPTTRSFDSQRIQIP